MKEILSIVAAAAIAILAFVVIHSVLHLEKRSNIIVALEVSAVVVLFAFVAADHLLHMMERIAALIRREQAHAAGGFTRVLVQVFVTIVVSLGIYFAFARYVAPPGKARHHGHRSELLGPAPGAQDSRAQASHAGPTPPAIPS